MSGTEPTSPAGDSVRVVVLGAGAAGLAAANRLGRHAEAGADLEVVLVDRALEHVFAPGYVAVMVDGADPSSFRRPLAELANPRIQLVHGEVTVLDPDRSRVSGTFGDRHYDHLIVALGPEIGWPGPAPVDDLAPWTLGGAIRGRDALDRLRPQDRVVVGPAGPAYRCPPAVFDLAVRVRRRTGSHVDIVHPWSRPLAPFGDVPAAAFSAMLDDAGVGFHGEFAIAQIAEEALTAANGHAVPFDTAIIVPPHLPPAVVAKSPLAGPSGWPLVTFPSFSHPSYENVAVIGDLAAPALSVGMAGTLAVFESAHVADAIAAKAARRPVATRDPDMSAICFVDTGDTGSFLHCDFSAPASGRGAAKCTLMPWLPYFRRAKQAFADEWFVTSVSGQVGGHTGVR